MVAYTYSRVAALNFNTTPPGVAKSATGSVYAIADTTFTTPLNMTMVVGGAVVTTISSDAQGFFPDFTVADRTSVVWKQASSSFTTVLTTSDPVPGPQGATGNPGAPGVKGDRGDLATWVTNTFYPLNMVIANPSGDLVKVITAHTSGASYDATKFGWVNNNAANLTGTLPEASFPTRLTTTELNNTYGPSAAGMTSVFGATAAPMKAAFEAKAFTPPLNYVPITGQVSGQSRYNGVSYCQDSVCTAGNVQYAGWYDQAGALLIGKRTLPSTVWTTFDLGTVAGNPLVLPVDTDSHNNVSLIVDAQGYIHVAANMHGDVLRYVKSTNPNDITAWTAPGMTGLNETQVTYPRFALHPDGTLFFMYRDGASGNGDVYLNRKNVGAAWTQLGKLADGKTTNENPYESRFVIDAAGTLAVAFTWRPNGGDHNTNNDVHYIKSTDKGATWKNVSNTTVTIPLVHADTVPLVLDTAATNSGIINQFGLDLDTSGNPHIALTLADGATPDRNIHHLYWTGSAWVNQQVTDLANGFGYNEMPTRPAVACTNDGRTLILVSYIRVTTKRGTFRVIDVTGGVSTDVPIANLDGRDFEMTYDGRALRERNELNIMLSQANAEVTAPGPDYWDINNWTRQWAGVLTVDLAQIGVVLRKEAVPPRIRTVASINVPNNSTVTATSDTIIPGSGGLPTPLDLRGKQVFARLTARASTTGGTLNISLFEIQQGGSSRIFGTIPFTGASTALRSGPWMPMQYGPINNADGLIQIMGRVSSTFTGTVSAVTLELGVID